MFAALVKLVGAKIFTLSVGPDHPPCEQNHDFLESVWRNSNHLKTFVWVIIR